MVRLTHGVTAVNKAPKIGQRVKVKAGHRFAAGLTGTVERIFKAWVCLNEDALEDPDVEPVFGGLKPESRWHAAVRVDTIPPNWPYYEQGPARVPQPVFAPEVSDLEAA